MGSVYSSNHMKTQTPSSLPRSGRKPGRTGGLKKDDEIVAVDGKPLTNLTTTEVGSLLTIAQETPALLRIRRGSKEFEVTVQRASMERIYHLPPQGKPAPSFDLPDTNGKTVSLQEFKGRPVIVNFLGHMVRTLRGRV